MEVSPSEGQGSAAAFDCRSCGACCQEGGVVPVYYGDGDETTPFHLTRSVRGRMGFGSWESGEGTRCMRTDADGRCVALRGEIGKRVGCASYDRRPKACREFDPGSEGCLEARKAFGAILSG